MHRHGVVAAGRRALGPRSPNARPASGRSRRTTRRTRRGPSRRSQLKPATNSPSGSGVARTSGPPRADRRRGRTASRCPASPRCRTAGRVASSPGRRAPTARPAPWRGRARACRRPGRHRPHRCRGDAARSRRGPCRSRRRARCAPVRPGAPATRSDLLRRARSRSGTAPRTRRVQIDARHASPLRADVVARSSSDQIHQRPDAREVGAGVVVVRDRAGPGADRPPARRRCPSSPSRRDTRSGSRSMPSK